MPQGPGHPDHDLAAHNVVALPTSPYLNRPLRSEAQARAERGAATRAGLLIAIDALATVAEKERERALDDQTRLACDSVMSLAQRARLAIVFADGAAS